MTMKSVLPANTSIWQKIGLIFFGLVLSVVLLEVGMRLGGFIILSMQEYGNLQSIRQKGTYRILCLGESTTQGQYPQYLEKLLNGRNVGVRFSVIDKGRAATNTTAILSHAKAYLLEYRPDMVIAMMGTNDWGPHIPFEPAATSKWTLFIRSFKIYKLAQFLRLHILTQAEGVGLYKPGLNKKKIGKSQTSFLESASRQDLAEPAFSENTLRQAVQLNSENDSAHFRLGWFFMSNGELVQAEDCFKRAIELNHENYNAYAGLGGLYRDRGEPVQAEKFFEKAVEFNPKKDSAYVQMGMFYQIEGKSSEAENSFRKAIAFNPENDNACVRLGLLYREQGKFPQAQDLLEKTIELNPENKLALRSMASLHEELGKPELSKEYTKKADQLQPGDYAAITVHNYRKLKSILDEREIKLVCVQYPMRNVESLKKIFVGDQDIVFVDNEALFKDAVKREGSRAYFRDMFSGDFGHCTQKGNELLAQNIADVILKVVFRK